MNSENATSRPSTSRTGQLVNADTTTYHADQLGTDQPTLSASLAHTLTTQSPAHAYAQHPRLNPHHTRKDDDKFSLGTVAHALLLQGIDVADVHEFDSWRTNEAKMMREASRQNGMIPLLRAQWDDVQRIVESVNTQLGRLDITPMPFTDGTAEVPILWEQDGAMCRALIDWLHTDCGAIVDLKTTAASALPAAWSKTAISIGADIQIAFHSAAVNATFGTRPEWRYVVVETYEPFATVVVQPDAEMIDLGRARMNAAIRTWNRCMETVSGPATRARRF